MGFVTANVGCTWNLLEHKPLDTPVGNFCDYIVLSSVLVTITLMKRHHGFVSQASQEPKMGLQASTTTLFQQFLNVQLRGINYKHGIVQPLLLFIFKCFS